MLKVLIYDTNYVNGISRIISITKIKYWQRFDTEVTICCTLEGKKFYEKEIPRLKFQIVDFTYHFNNSYDLIWDILKITFKSFFLLPHLKGKYDIVYSQSGVIDFLIIPFFLRLYDKKIKWFVQIDNIVPLPGKRPGSILKQLFPYLAFLLGNIFLKKADGIFVVTDFLYDYYRKKGMNNIIKTNDGYGIQTEIFTGKVSKDAPKVDALYCGRIHTAKGIMDLVEVIKKIKLFKPDFIMGILGDGEESIKNFFYKTIKEYDLEKNFLHFGYKTGKEKGGILRNSKLFLFLSYDEGCPHAVIEAFACNKQVFAYDLPIYHSVFKKYLKSRQLKIFKKKDYAKIAKTIISFNENYSKYNNKLSSYTWDIISEKELLSMKGLL